MTREEDPNRPPLKSVDVASMKTMPQIQGAAPWKAKPAAAAFGKRVVDQVALRSGQELTDAIAFSGGPTPHAFVFNHFVTDPVSRRSTVRVDRFDMTTGKFVGGAELFPAPEYDEHQLTTSKKRETRPFMHRSQIPLEVGASLDGSRFFALPKEAPDVLDVWNADGKNVVAWKPGEKDEANVEEAHFVDADHLLVRTDAGKVALWKIPECRAIYEIGGIQNRLALTADRAAFFAVADGSPELFDSLSGERLGTLENPASGAITAIQSAEFSPDGRHLAAIANVGANNVFLVKWSMANGKALGEILVHLATERTLRWAGNEHQTIGEDLYDWNFRGRLHHYVTHQNHGNPAAIKGSPDGRRWFQTRGNAGGNMLVGFVLPDADALKYANLIAKGNLESAYPPGTKVKLNINVGGAADAIRDGIEKSLTAKGYVLGEGGLVVNVNASEVATGKNLQLRIRNIGIGPRPGGPPPVNVVNIADRTINCDVTVTDAGGREIAKHQNKIGIPHFTFFKTEDFDREISERMWESARMSLSGTVQLHKYYRVEGALVTFPRVSFLMPGK